MQRFEGLDRHHVGRLRRRGLEQVAQPLAVTGQNALERIERHQRQQQGQHAPFGVSADLREAERQVALGFQVVDRLRGRVDLERGHLQIERVARPERIDDVLVGIQHGRQSEVPLALLERRQRVALAQPEVASVAFERVDRVVLDQFEGTSLLVFEFRELHHLHQILVHLDRQVEPVADHDAVRLDARRDRRCVLRPDGRARKEQCYCKKSFHRCLNSFNSSAT